MKILTTFFLTGAFFYTIPILIQYGYNSYFGIPPVFIEPSIRDNITYIFDLSRLAASAAAQVASLLIIALVPTAIAIWIIIKFKFLNIGIVSVILGVAMLALLGGFYSFGEFIAKESEVFRVIPHECIDGVNDRWYAIPSFYKTTALVVPVYKDSKKLTGGFMAKELSTLNCEINRTIIGPVIR